MSEDHSWGIANAIIEAAIAGGLEERLNGMLSVKEISQAGYNCMFIETHPEEGKKRGEIYEVRIKIP